MHWCPCGVILVLAVGLWSIPRGNALARPAKTPAYEPYMRSAAKHLEAEDPDYLRAAQEYEGAFDAMSPELRVDEMGQFVIAEVVRLYWEELWPKEQDLDQLQACRELLQRYLDELDGARKERRPTSAPNELEISLRKTLGDVEEAIEAKEAESRTKDAEAARAAEEAAKAKQWENATPPRMPRKETRPDALGLSFASVGGALATGGAILFADGLLFPSMITAAKAKQRRIDEQEGHLQPGAPDPPRYVEHEERMRRRGNIILVTGVSSFAIGVALLTWGSVRLVRNRQGASNTAFRMGTMVSSRVAGLEAELRF